MEAKMKKQDQVFSVLVDRLFWGQQDVDYVLTDKRDDRGLYSKLYWPLCNKINRRLWLRLKETR